MHICIIGTGASGWMTCSILRQKKYIDKITIIGSPSIPTIGVGESTTLNFLEFLEDCGIEEEELARECDASFKYGVYYQNWSKKDFIHHFKNSHIAEERGIDLDYFGKTLANKNKNSHVHDFIGKKLWNFIQENKISEHKDEYLNAWHFEANKFISFLEKRNLSDPKINFISDTVVKCKYVGDTDEIKNIKLKSGKKITADYYVISTGQSCASDNIFKEEYESYSNYLLANKAVVSLGVNYKDKQKEFYPYTVAKTMKYGWRWITPTYSRIGTGYVFSDRHVSHEEAIKEFMEDIDDDSVTPAVVDFYPRRNAKPYKSNNCVIGMAQGFLEPLDASGLTITFHSILHLCNILEGNLHTNDANELERINYQFWCSFILLQYKTCYRDDTEFWKDHKNVSCPFFDELMHIMINQPDLVKDLSNNVEFFMLFQTLAGKDFRWSSGTSEKPQVIEDKEYRTCDHLKYIDSLHVSPK
jgi:tryptophan 7-halogenase